MTNGQKYPVKVDQRRESVRKATETRKKNKLAQQTLMLQIPRSFPDDQTSRKDTPTDTEATIEPFPQVRQQIPSLTFTTIEGEFEGPHTITQPAGIRRERHEQASRALQLHG